MYYFQTEKDSRSDSSAVTLSSDPESEADDRNHNVKKDN